VLWTVAHSKEDNFLVANREPALAGGMVYVPTNYGDLQVGTLPHIEYVNVVDYTTDLQEFLFTDQILNQAGAVANSIGSSIRSGVDNVIGAPSSPSSSHKPTKTKPDK
jgi:hypothetical protein